MYELYFITDRKLCKKGEEEQVAAAIRGGADIVQYREKELGFEQKVKKANTLKEICYRAEVDFIVNDDVDVALEIEANGVHVGQKDEACKEARKKLGNGKLIGVSASTVSEAVKAEKDGADYIGLGPIFHTTTKKDAGPARGLSLIHEVRKQVKIPLVAIGGITKKNAANVVIAGADGVSAVSELVCAVDIEDAVREMRNIVVEAKKKRK